MFFNFFSKHSVKNIFQSLYENLKNILRKSTNLVKTNFDLGIYHLDHNHLSDAILRFKIVKFFDKDNNDIYYYLGKAFFSNQEKLEAEKNFLKSIELNQKIEESQYFLSLINNKYPMIQRIPISIIKDYYNKQIYSSESTHINKFIIENIIKYLKYSPKKILDLGCGRGDIGNNIKEKFEEAEITGVEISNIAIDEINRKVKNKIIYSSLIEQDFYQYLTGNNDAYDLIFAIDSLCSDQHLENILKLIKPHLSNNGVFIMQIKMHDNNINCNNINQYFTYDKSVIERALVNTSYNILDILNADERLLYICTIK